MENNKLIKNLEQLSFNIPNRLLRLKGYVFDSNQKEYLEIIIFKGFSSSTTHSIDPDHENSVIDKNYILLKCQLLKAPISDKSDEIIKENENIQLFLNINYWY